MVQQCECGQIQKSLHCEILQCSTFCPLQQCSMCDIAMHSFLNHAAMSKLTALLGLAIAKHGHCMQFSRVGLISQKSILKMICNAKMGTFKNWLCQISLDFLWCLIWHVWHSKNVMFSKHSLVHQCSFGILCMIQFFLIFNHQKIQCACIILFDRFKVDEWTGNFSACVSNFCPLQRHQRHTENEQRFDTTYFLNVPNLPSDFETML